MLVAAVLLLAAAGFYPSYLGLAPSFDGVGWQVHFHLFTVLAWLAMLVVQAWLAATNQLERHRAVGRLSFVLVPAVLAGFVFVTSYGQLRHKEPALLGAALLDGGLFVTLYALAIRHRRNPAYHSRYLLLTPVSFLNPTLGRAVSPALSAPAELLVFIVLAVLARRQKRPARPYVVAAAVYVGLSLLVVVVSVVEPGILEALWTYFWGDAA